MYVLPVLLDPVSALDQFKGGPVQTRTRTMEDRSGPVLSGPVLVLEFPEDFRTGPVLVLSKIDPRTGPDRTLKHYLRPGMEEFIAHSLYAYESEGNIRES